jgi:NOL1/NOP2/fmu family ribosome biogenesis protein
MHTVASPDEYEKLSSLVRIVKDGTRLFREMKDDIIPLHDLALSGILNDEAFPSWDIDLDQSLSYLKKETLSLPRSEKGWLIVRYRGKNLGFVKNIGSRLNNYYPAELRIRMQVGDDLKSKIIEWI